MLLCCHILLLPTYKADRSKKLFKIRYSCFLFQVNVILFSIWVWLCLLYVNLLVPFVFRVVHSHAILTFWCVFILVLCLITRLFFFFFLVLQSQNTLAVLIWYTIRLSSEACGSLTCGVAASQQLLLMMKENLVKSVD